MRRIFLKSRPVLYCLVFCLLLIFLLRATLPSGGEIQDEVVVQLEDTTDGASENQINYCQRNSVNDSIPETDLQDFFLNPHPFDYMICPNVMCSANLTVITMIHSAPGNYEKRKLIRETWGDYGYYKDFSLRVIFVLGKPADVESQRAITQESKVHGDILQENFADAYRNLTYKFVAVLKFVHLNCAEVPYLLKCDDDAFINVFALMKLIHALPASRQHQLMLCNILPSRASRDNSSKWHVTREDWAEEFFPEPCAGGAVVISNDLFTPLYNESFYTRFLWLDDVYVTGILAQKLNVSHTPLNDAMQYNIAFMRFAYRFGREAELKSIVCYDGSIPAKTSLWMQILSIYNEDFRFYNETLLPIIIIGILILSLFSILFVLYLIAD